MIFLLKIALEFNKIEKKIKRKIGFVFKVICNDDWATLSKIIRQLYVNADKTKIRKKKNWIF